jgi:hypothetical protein
VTRAEISLRDQKRENDAVDVAMAEYRRLVPDAPSVLLSFTETTTLKNGSSTACRSPRPGLPLSP